MKKRKLNIKRKNILFFHAIWHPFHSVTCLDLHMCNSGQYYFLKMQKWDEGIIWLHQTEWKEPSKCSQSPSFTFWYLLKSISSFTFTWGQQLNRRAPLVRSFTLMKVSFKHSKRISIELGNAISWIKINVFLTWLVLIVRIRH